MTDTFCKTFENKDFTSGKVRAIVYKNTLNQDKGLVYSVYSYSDMFINHSTLTVITNVGSDKYKQTISLLDENLSKDNLLTINLSEFEKAKTLLCLNFAKEFSIKNIIKKLM